MIFELVCTVGRSASSCPIVTVVSVLAESRRALSMAACVPSYHSWFVLETKDVD
jgi:hypothetical protein